MFVILSGSLSVQLPGAGKYRSRRLAILREGQLVGEYGFIRNCRISSADVVADEVSVGLVCSVAATWAD